MKNIKYNFKSFSFEIQSDIGLESDIKNEILPASVDYKNDEDAENPAQIIFKIIKSAKYEDEFTIFKDQEKVCSYDNKDSALFGLEWIVTCSVLEQSRSFLQLHAGGIVNDNNKAMLIIADHGIGKSSLVIGLLLKGYKCLSDDIVLIDTDSGDLHFFPRAFKISADLFRYLPELKKRIDLKTINALDENMFKRVNPERICRKPFSNSSTIGWTIFLTNNGSTECRLRKVGQIGAFELLLRGAFNMHDYGYEGIDTIANIIESSSCYEMNRGNLNEAVSLLSNLMVNKERNP